MGITVINIRVGPEPSHTDFTVHENLLRKSSPFFEAALGREWLESEERVVRLPTNGAKAFQVYSQWLYTGRLHTRLSSDRKIKYGLREEWKCLVSAYLLGEYLQEITFRDSVMDAMQEWVQLYTTMSINAYESATEIYDNTSSGSPLRLLVTDLTVWRANDLFWIEEQQFRLPPEFTWSLAIGLRTRLTGRESSLEVDEPFARRRDTCHYHCHGLQQCYRGTH
jgi:hypothetical protein